jgi:single-stranded-DNA-specific exonuclease
MKKWEIQNKYQPRFNRGQISNIKYQKEYDELLSLLLENRGLTEKGDIEAFLHPKLEDVTIEYVGIDTVQLQKTILRIKQAIDNKEKIVVFGDYDVDGICGTAILWETFYSYSASVIPYIPHRIDEGYGLSIKGISNLKQQIPDLSLIITVDNGIVAKEAVKFANEQEIDVIITDHHVKGDILPDAFSIVHTTKLCGTGVGYMLSEAYKKEYPMHTPWSRQEDHLELVALATIADLVPLTHANRTLTTYGIKKLHTTKRIGILELCKEAALDQKDIGVYEIGHTIAPRLNAMGRMEYAMESLRLLCTKDSQRALDLAQKIGQTNRERQVLTQESVLHAKELVKNQTEIGKLLFIAHESYQQGIIGLIAGKLVEEYYRPAIVLAVGEKYSKASARSVHGFNIIEFIRSASEFLVDAGGHPMAAGFTVETEKLPLLQNALETLVNEKLDIDLLIRSIRIDCELFLQDISEKVYETIMQLAPFGMGNPEPVFVSRGVEVLDMRLVGKDKNHVKLCFCEKGNKSSKLDCIAFGMGDRSSDLIIGSIVDIVYTIALDTWNGNKRMQLKIKDVKKVS